MQVQNKVPLLTIAVTLFGPGSFIDAHVLNPSPLIDAAQRLPNGTCTGFAPLSYFLLDTTGIATSHVSNDQECIVSNATWNVQAVDLQVRTPIRIFANAHSTQLSTVVKAAAFLATKAWIDHQVRAQAHLLTVQYDLGIDTVIASISLVGIIIISTLYVVFLLSLLAMAAYPSWTPRWTHSLDVFTMMRLGAGMGEDRVPLLVASRQRLVRALDEMPGWVGNGCDGKDFGRLSLSADAALRKERRYA